jgi:hypothetical protein
LTSATTLDMSGHEADVPEMTPMVLFQVYLK